VAKPVSPVAICNLALGRIAQNPIASVDDPTTEVEETMARWYDHTRRVLLRSYLWNFAKARTTISRIGTPAFDYTDQYQLPNDFIRLISLGGDNELDGVKAYDIQNKTILINNSGAASLKLRYISDVTDVTQFDDLFRDLLIIRLAKNVAYKFTVKASIVEKLEADIVITELKAVNVDGQERHIQKRHISKVLNSRRGFYGPGRNLANYNDGDY
jgi:hypothetical protein